MPAAQHSAQLAILGERGQAAVVASIGLTGKLLRPLAIALSAAMALHGVLLLSLRLESAPEMHSTGAPVLTVRLLPSAEEGGSNVVPVETIEEEAAQAPIALPAKGAGAPERAEASPNTAVVAPRAPSKSEAESPSSQSRAVASVGAALPASAVAHDDGPKIAPPARAVAAPEPALPAAPDYLTGSQLDPGPRPLHDIDPTYPTEAGLREGIVVLRLLVNQQGIVDDVGVVRASPKGLFESAAVKSFAEATFSPGMVQGLPVKSQITVEVHFAPINRGATVSGRNY